MPAAKQRPFNAYSMSEDSRRKAYAKINILWKQMRPDLHFEDKDTIRDERLTWIASFLNLKKLESTTNLSPRQLGRVVEEMMRLTGQQPKPRQNAPKSQPSGILGIVGAGAEIIHLTSPEQLFALEILEKHIGWTPQQRENYLKPRFNRTNFRTLKFDQANSLMMQMLTIGAQKDLKLILGPDVKISRRQIRKYIPDLKKRLEIDKSKSD